MNTKQSTFVVVALILSFFLFLFSGTITSWLFVVVALILSPFLLVLSGVVTPDFLEALESQERKLHRLSVWFGRLTMPIASTIAIYSTINGGFGAVGSYGFWIGVLLSLFSATYSVMMWRTDPNKP